MWCLQSDQRSFGEFESLIEIRNKLQSSFEEHFKLYIEIHHFPPPKSLWLKWPLLKVDEQKIEVERVGEETVGVRPGVAAHGALAYPNELSGILLLCCFDKSVSNNTC